MLRYGFLCTCLLITICQSASLHPEDSLCRCVADQWQAILKSTDREFDLGGARTAMLENQIHVSYDFKNKMFAMTDLNSGNRAIADYNKGYKYVMREDGCRRIDTREEMKQMCLPDHAVHGGEFRIAEKALVDMWEFSAPHNMSMKTTVLRSHCLPVTEEVFMTNGDYASLTTSMYLDISLGIKDRNVFKPSKTCVFDSYAQQMNVIANNPTKTKKSDSSWTLMNFIRDAQLQ